MPLNDYLIHTVIIERRLETRGSAGEVIVGWAVVQRVAGRFVEKSERVLSAMGLVTMVSRKLLVAATVEISSDDRIQSVTLEDGTVVGPFVVREPLRRLGRQGVSHRTLMLERVEVT